MKKILQQIAILFIFDIPFILWFIISTNAHQHRIGIYKKAVLAIRVIYNNIRIKTISTYYQHLVIIKEILCIPKEVQGDVIECGCFDGASTANLSLACSICGRRLFVCDSFEGLPSPKEKERFDVRSDSIIRHEWKKGELAPNSGLEGVKENISKHGDISVCQFVEGYFNETLSKIDTKDIVCVFEDAVLQTSVKDCIKYLWPKLKDQTKFFCHEPWAKEVVRIFYDAKWWRENLNQSYPGFYGSGNGVKIGLRYLKMGYAIKSNTFNDQI